MSESTIHSQVRASLSNPTEQRPPPRRTRLQGGFVITPQTALEWAKRIAPIPIELTKNDMSVVWQFIEDRIGPKGGRFSSVGEVIDAEFMVVTQGKRFNGYKGMDPSLIPQFKEGPREAVVRQMLDEEGASTIKQQVMIGNLISY